MDLSTPISQSLVDYSDGNLHAIALGHHQFGTRQMSRQTVEAVNRVLVAGDEEGAFALLARAGQKHHAAVADILNNERQDRRKEALRLRLLAKLKAKG
jgi:hypothetical protein